MPDPIYRRHPDLFAFNTVTKKHMLRDGRAYKKAFEANPEQFVDSSSMFRTAETPPAPAVISPSLPAPVVEIPVKKHEGAREQVKQIISAELTENPKSYAGKSKPELDSMFRALLIERLSASAPPSKTKSPDVNKSIKPVKPAANPKKQVFKLRPPPMSDMEDESESEESD